MEKVIIASNNMNKIREFSEMLGKDCLLYTSDAADE